MKKLLISISAIILSLSLTTPLGLAKGHGGGGSQSGGGAVAGGGFSHGSPGGSAPHFSSAPRHYSASGWNARPYHPGSYHPSTLQGVNRSTRIHASGTGQTNSPGLQSAASRNFRSAANDGKWSHSNRMGRSRLDPQTSARLRNWSGGRDNLAQARLKHAEHCRHHHNRDWWRRHCAAIIFFDWGFWAWDAGWWYPAWGYDPYYSYYEDNQPIYGYDGLPPDQVVANVQGALQELGYYHDPVDGILGPLTRAAIADYQRDNGLPISSAIDEPLLVSLGFIAP
jgi:Putative peptidoglycan binding domain